VPKIVVFQIQNGDGAVFLPHVVQRK